MLPDCFTTDHFLFRHYTTISEEDSYALWQARNDDSIRMNMENSNKFTLESHREYVHHLKILDDRAYYAVYHYLDRWGWWHLNA